MPDTSPLDEAEDESDLSGKKRKITSSSSGHQTTTRTPLVTLQGHTQPATAVVWAEQGEIMSAGWDLCIRVWDVTTGSNVTTMVCMYYLVTLRFLINDPLPHLYLMYTIEWTQGLP